MARLRRALPVALLAALLCAGLAGPAAASPPASIAALEASLAARRTTCSAVVAGALARIRAVERGPRRPRAVLETNPDAPAIARALDAEQRATGQLRPLHCVTLLVKDNYETADRLQTTVGSLTMLGFRATRDARIVARLRAAGAVVLGKTNMDEWAHGATGYSSRGGQTRNGLRALRQPGGSSGGSAAAVAKRLALVATGSDTGGSIQIPANFNGVVGIRGTLGLVSRGGVVPFASVSDVPGPITGTVADAARVLGFLTGVDPADPDTRASAGHFRTDYTGFLDRGGLRGARIGVLRGIYGQRFTGDSAAVDRAFAAALARMRRAGATVVELPAPQGKLAQLLDVPNISVRQFKPEIDAWLRGPGAGAPVDSLAEILAASRRPPARGRVRILAALEGDLKAPAPRGRAYQRWLAGARRFRAVLDGLLRRHRLDAITYPNNSCPAPPLPGVVDPTYACRGASQPLEPRETPGSVAALLSPDSGLPVLSVPGPAMPGSQRVGLTLLGRAWSEGELLRLGSAYEQAR